MPPTLEELQARVTELEGEVEAGEQRLAEVQAKFQEAEPGSTAYERKMRFLDLAQKSDVNLVELAIAKRVFEKRIALGVDEALPPFIEAQIRTMTTEGTGTGAELLDTILSTELWSDMHVSPKVATLFAPVVDMPSKTFELPEELGNVKFRKPAGEGQAVTATDLKTAKRSLTACPLKAQVDISDEEDQDAVIAMLPRTREKLMQNAREVIDEMVVNADASTGTQNINWYLASGGTKIEDGTDDRFLLGFDGLIHYCKNELTGTPQDTDLGDLANADFITMIGLLGKYASNPARCAWIIDVWTRNKALGITEFMTMEKVGPRATVLTGQIAEAYGSPVILTDQMLKSNATGQVDQTPASNTKGRLLLVNRDMWVYGVRRPVRVATERSEAKGLTSLVVTMRIALQCFGDRTDPKYCHTALGYNVTV